MRRKGLPILLAVVALLLVASPNAAAQDIIVTAPTIERVGQELRASEGSWQPPAGATPTYQWSRCISGVCQAILGATGRTREITQEDFGNSLQITLTVTRTVGGQQFSATSQPFLIPLEPPSNTSRPTITGLAREGHVLTASPGSWGGTPPLSFAYEWRRCNEDGESCNIVVHVGSASYTLSAADVRSTVRVVVTATNAADSSSERSDPTNRVARAPLVNEGPPTITGVAEVDQSLTATPGEWESSGPIEFRYEWQRCRTDGSGCDRILGADRAAYQVRLLDVGFRLRVRVTAIGDAGAGSETRESALTGVVPAPAGVLPFTQSGGSVLPRTTVAFMRPFPRVRIKGYYTPRGAVLQLLTIKGAAGARIALVCRGSRCPYRRRAWRARQRVRVRSLERTYSAGTRLTVRITKAALIGKYTRIVIRANRVPKRRDRCLMPGSTKPVLCPLPE